MMDTFRDVWRGLFRRLSGWAERLSAWLHPGWRVAPLTTGRVMEFHDFLRDCGFEAAWDAAESPSANGQALGGPAGLGVLADQMEEGPSQDVDPDKAKEVAARLRQALIEKGKLVELNQILFDVSEQEVRQIPTAVVEATFATFLIGWLRHLTRLMGTASATTSQPAETPQS